MKKAVYISLVIILVVVAIAIFLNYQNIISSKINNKSCNSDSDCTVVATLDPLNSCCTTCDGEAISKQAATKRSEWHVENCKNAECPIYNCYNEKLPKPRCINNRCEIEWVERPK